MQLRNRKWLTVAVAVALAGCGSTAPHNHAARGATGPGAKHLPGAEPAVSPAPPHAPAGRIVQVGAQPEGIVTIPDDGLVAVATREPAALTVLSARTGATVRRIPFTGAARHLALDGDDVLLPDSLADELLRIDPLTGATVATKVGSLPHDAAAADGKIFVADEFGRAVSVIDGSGEVRAIPGFTQPGGVAAVGGDVAVVDVGADTLTLLDAQTLLKLATLPAGAGPTHVVALGHDLFVADTRGDALREYAVLPYEKGIARLRLRQIATLALPGTPYGIAADPAHDRVYVTLTATDTLDEVAPDGGALRTVATYPTVRQPNTVAVDPATGRVFVAGAAQGEIELIDPR